MANKKHLSLLTLAASSTLLLSTGCASRMHGDDFMTYEAPTSTGEMAMAQSSSGAAEDAMLYDVNFHGQELNTLGQGKLDLITKGTHPGDPVVVYLNMPKEKATLREAAVKAFLKGEGISDDLIVLNHGPNPLANTPAAYNLNTVYKSDGASFNGQAADQDATGAAGGITSAGGGTTK